MIRLMAMINIVLFTILGLWGPSSGQTVPLCGDASPIQWDMNSESDMAEYRVYTATTAGTINPATQSPTWTVPHVINPATPNLIVYTLNAVIPDGITYFAVAARDTSSNQSGLSNELVCNLQIGPSAPTNLVIGVFAP